MTSTHLSLVDRVQMPDGEVAVESDEHALLEDQHMKALARVPDPDSFGGADYRVAPELEAIAETLISRHDLDAQYFAIEILWKKKLGTTRGNPVWGKTQILSGLTKFYAKKVDIVICMAANHARDYRITNFQLEAALFEELQRIAAVTDDSGNTYPTLDDPDLGGYSRGIVEYGDWRPEYRKMRTALKQARLIPDGFLT